MYRLTTELQKVTMRSDGNATRQALMAAGEYLMGEQGIDAPPLHVIATEAGQSNKYAVQYHFNDREGLVHAIMMKRNEAVVLRRAELALEAVAMGAMDNIDTLVEAMFLPVIEQVGEKSPSSYFRLLMLWLNLPWQHDLMLVREDVADDPHTKTLVTFFEKALPHLSPAKVRWRLRIQSRQVLNCLVEHDNLDRLGKTVAAERQLIFETFAMVSAAMTA